MNPAITITITITITTTITITREEFRGPATGPEPLL